MVFITKQPLEGDLSEEAREQYFASIATNNQAYATVCDSYAEVTQVHAAKERENISTAIELLKGKRGVVADFGCGFGRDAEFWITNGMQYYGCDCSVAMIHVAQKRHVPGKFHVGDMLTTTLKQNSVHIVWFSSCLQHVPSSTISYILRNAVAGLVKGGLVYANYRPPKQGVAKEGILESGEYSNASGEKVRIKRFIAHYSRDEMSRYFQEAGLSVVDATDYEECYDDYDAEKGAYLPKKEIIFGRKE